MSTNLYLALRGTYEERREKLRSFPKEYLEDAILDSEYNDFLGRRADYEDDENDEHGHGKRLPYIGWYWRHIAFSGAIPIGDCGEFVGFMGNNKWDYPERDLTEQEKSDVMRIIDEAMVLASQGGLLSDIQKNTNAKLRELWNYMQTLKV